MNEKLWYLKRCDLFERLSPKELERVESLCRAKSLPRNTPIYLPIDDAQSVFLLASGRVKICHGTPDGKQAILAFVEPGELFGELAVFDAGAREEYAETVEPSTVVMIPREELQRLIQDHPVVSMNLTRMMGLRRRRIERRLKNLLFLSNRDRLTHLLLELAEQYGDRNGDGVQLRIRLSHQDLASIIGSTRETVTGVLGEMQAEGLVSVGRRKILIRRPERLAEQVERSFPAPHVPHSRPAAASSGS
jgi:CRP-like cAMP-binding protein